MDLLLSYSDKDLHYNAIAQFVRELKLLLLKAHTPYWAHKLTKKRRKTWFLSPFYICLCSELLCNHLETQEGQDLSITCLQ
jgi:hypothetical protein